MREGAGEGVLISLEIYHRFNFRPINRAPGVRSRAQVPRYSIKTVADNRSRWWTLIKETRSQRFSNFPSNFFRD